MLEHQVMHIEAFGLALDIQTALAELVEVYGTGPPIVRQEPHELKRCGIPEAQHVKEGAAAVALKKELQILRGNVAILVAVNFLEGRGEVFDERPLPSDLAHN